MVSLKQFDILCLYKTQGKLLPSWKKWLNENERYKIIFLDDKVIKTKTKNSSSLFFSSEKDLKEKLLKIAWENVFLKIGFFALEENQDFSYVKNIATEMFFAVEALFSDYSDFGLTAFKNTIHNLLNKKNKNWEFFQDKTSQGFKNIPAIICGAGPSLNLLAPFLRKINNKALIFAGGTALPCTRALKIKVNFGAAIDKHEHAWIFAKKHILNIPFFYESRLSPNIVASIKHPYLIRSYETLLEKWLLDELKIKKIPFDGGWNVSTFLIHLAYNMGCNPIILAGIDLCYGDKKYAKGAQEEKKQHVVVFDGKKTQKDWVLAKKWIENFAFTHDNVIFFNLSKGFTFSGIKNINEKILGKKILKKGFKRLEEIIEKNSQPLHIERKKIKNLLQDMERSLHFCQKVCRKMIGGDMTKIEEKISSQIAYKFFLQPIWDFFQYPIMREVKEKTLLAYQVNQALFYLKIIEECLQVIKDAKKT